jgi:hypothetical protein
MYAWVVNPTSSVAVPRHPTVPSPSLDDVLLSGSRGGSIDGGVVLNATAVECFVGPTSRGKGWLIDQEAGMVFFPAPNLFTPEKTSVVGLQVDAHRIQVDSAEFNLGLAAMRDQLVCIPYVDIVWLGHLKHEAMFTWNDASFLFIVCDDLHGNRREYSLKAAPDWYAPSNFSLCLDNRWQNECAALVTQIVDDLLGGEAFWEGTREALRAEGLPNFGSIFSSSGSMPRVIDGPDETLERVQEHIAQALGKFGFDQAEAIATVYWHRHGASAWTGTPDSFGRQNALGAALEDPKLSTLLIERWQPIHDAFKAARDAIEPSQVWLHGMDWIEETAAKYGG